MSNITRLPDSFERQWRVYEGELREHFAAADATPDEIDHVAACLKPIYMQSARMSFSRNSSDGEQVVRDLNAWVQSQVFRLMLEVAIRDIELYRLRDG